LKVPLLKGDLGGSPRIYNSLETASKGVIAADLVSFPANQRRLPADCGKVTLWKISTPLWVESRNLNLSELASEKKGYRRDIKKTSGESPRL
jgi:hypothetical protein